MGCAPASRAAAKTSSRVVPRGSQARNQPCPSTIARYPANWSSENSGKHPPRLPGRWRRRDALALLRLFLGIAGNFDRHLTSGNATRGTAHGGDDGRVIAVKDNNQDVRREIRERVSVAAGAAQRRRWRGNRGRPLASLRGLLADITRADEIDQRPSVVFGQDRAETGHQRGALRIGDPVRDPPEQLAVEVPPKVRRRQIGPASSPDQRIVACGATLAEQRLAVCDGIHRKSGGSSACSWSDTPRPATIFPRKRTARYR